MKFINLGKLTKYKCIAVTHLFNKSKTSFFNNDGEVKLDLLSFKDPTTILDMANALDRCSHTFNIKELSTWKTLENDYLSKLITDEDSPLYEGVIEEDENGRKYISKNIQTNYGYDATAHYMNMCNSQFYASNPDDSGASELSILCFITKDAANNGYSPLVTLVYRFNIKDLPSYESFEAEVATELTTNPDSPLYEGFLQTYP